MRYLEDEINWKGIGDYLSAARTIQEHGSTDTSGPRIHCQGLALELALKFYLLDSEGKYPVTHDLEKLAFDKCKALSFSEDETMAIENLNKQYLKDGDSLYPARYRPVDMRVFVTPSIEVIEGIVANIIKNTSRPELTNRILAR